MTYTPDMVSSGLKMTGALVLVLGIVLLSAYIAKRFLSQRNSNVRNGSLRILGTQYVGVKKNIMLLEVPGAVLVLGITGDRINLLDKIQDQEALQKLEQSDGPKAPTSFLAHLNQIRKRAETPKSS